MRELPSGTVTVAERYYVCFHPEHAGAMEIFSHEDYREARRIDRRYQVLQKTASKEAALFFAQDVIAQALILDPELKNLKEDIRELYL